jgi:hypothetical protein
MPVTGDSLEEVIDRIREYETSPRGIIWSLDMEHCRDLLIDVTWEWFDDYFRRPG